MDLTAFLADPVDTTWPLPIPIKGATRADLIPYLAACGYRVGAEIGVYEGEYAEALCLGIPGLTLWCIDAWSRFLGADGRDIYKSAEPAYALARARLAPFDCRFLHAWSPGAAAVIPDGSLDFLYLDADHRLAAVVADLAAWVPKVRSGGIVAGHDYEERPNKHNAVAMGVQAWTAAHGITPWFVLGRARVRPGEAHEVHRTWFWRVP